MKRKTRYGLSFVDELAKTTKSFKHYNLKFDAQSWQDSLISGQEAEAVPAGFRTWRVLAFVAIFLIAFSAIFVRLFHLQVTQGSTNRALADSNRIQVKTIHAPRGVIYDRNGKILAQNEPGFRLLGRDNNQKTRYLSREQALDMEVRTDPQLPNLEIDNLRHYPYASETAHLLGYVGEISGDELKQPDFKGYNPGDLVGKEGIEQVYEKVLRGVDGGEVIEVDAKGQKIRTLGKTDPIPGQNVYLTIDVGLQEQAYKQLQKAIIEAKVCCGSVVAQDPRNGQILAMVSIPSYMPSQLEQAFSAPNFPFLNRAIAGTYPPGSTFKIATALSGLDSGKITPSTEYVDTGVLNLGPYTFANWYFTEYGRKEDQPVNVVRALQRSNDIFFYHLGQVVGEKIMGDEALKLGFGQKLGVDLPGEETGLIPDDNWKQKTIGDVWYPGDSLHMAIGQGYVLVTPLQVNNLISTIAANGQQFPPHLAFKITSPEGRELKNYHFDGSKFITTANNMSLIKQGLEMVPKPGGTAWPFFTFPIATAGKTGTAEFGDPKNKTHAWYTSYAPANNPQIALTVMVEGGGEGSSVAGPVSKEIYRYYFSPDKSNLIKDITAFEATTGAHPIGE